MFLRALAVPLSHLTPELMAGFVSERIDQEPENREKSSMGFNQYLENESSA